LKDGGRRGQEEEERRPLSNDKWEGIANDPDALEQGRKDVTLTATATATATARSQQNELVR